jgi:ABC-type uncharacterized transport system involved in gliding motility auxiliary subunit
MTLFSAILFSVFTSAMFFIKGQFFAGSGTTDLLTYFSSLPYVCIIVIPCLCYKRSISIYDDFIPQSRLKKICKSFYQAFLRFVILILMMLPVCLLVNLFGSIDPGQIFTSFICLLFYGACLISLCIFINELIPNSIAAFTVSAIILAIFNSIHNVSLYVNAPDFISSICKLLSFAWHFDAASKGIFDTRDIFWLLLWAAFFLFAAYFTVEIKRGYKASKNQKLFFTIILYIFILALATCNNLFARLDLSKNKSFSISAYTKNLVESIDDTLNITYYRSGSLSKLYPQIRDVTDFLNSFSILDKQIHFTIKDPDKDSETKTMLENYGITSQQLQNTGVNSTQFINVYSAVVLEYKGNIQLIPFIMSGQTLEYDLDIRLKNLITKKNIAVNILVGNEMSLTDDYSYIIPWLSSQGILVNPLYLEDPTFTQVLASRTGPLFVIGDSNINIEKAIAIENYILNKNHNAIFAVSPYSATIEDDWSLTANKWTNLVEIIENWGARFTDKIAADISCARITMYSEDDQKEVLNYPLWPNLMPQQNCLLGMTLFWPVCLELSQNAEPYLVTSSLGYNYQTDKASPSRLLETNPFLVKIDDAANHQRGTQIIGAQITGPLTGLFNYGSCEDSNIIVIPDQYFLNTTMTGYIGGDFGDYRNFEFISNCILNLNGEGELAKLQSKTKKDTSLYKINDFAQLLRLMYLVYAVSFVIIPLIYVVAFITTRIIRNKRRININD